MTHEALEHAVPLYVVGALERAERQTLEAHLLSGCVPCHTAFKEYQSVAVALPFGLTITPPPRALKGKILAARMPVSAIESTVQSPAKPSLEPGEWMNHLFPPSSSSTISFDWVLGMVFLAVLVSLAFLTWNASTHGNGETEKLAELQAQAETASTKLTTLQKQLGEREESLTQTREELQRRMAELAELKDQLIQREAEVDDLKAQLAQRGGRSVRMP